MANDSLTITIGADITGVRTQVALLKSELGSLQRQASSSARAVNKTGDALKLAELGQTVGKIEQVKGSLGALEGALNKAGDAALNMGITVRHGVAIVDGAMRHQRGQVIASLSALIRDSGIAGVALKALASPWGPIGAAAVAAGAIVGGVLATIGIEAVRTRTELDSVWNAAIRHTENPAAAVQRAKMLAGIIGHAGSYNQSVATAGAAEIVGIPGLNLEAQKKLASVYEAYSRVNPEKVQPLAKQFASAESMRKYVEQNPLAMSEAQYKGFATALSGSNLAAARNRLAAAIARQYAPEAAAVQSAANQVFTPGIGTEYGAPIISVPHRLPALNSAPGANAERLQAFHRIDEEIKKAAETQRRTEAALAKPMRAPRQESAAAAQSKQRVVIDKAYDVFSDKERLKVAQANGATAQIIAIYDEWAAHAAAIYGKNSTQFLTLETRKTQIANEAARAQTRAFNEMINKLAEGDEQKQRKFIADAKAREKAAAEEAKVEAKAWAQPFTRAFDEIGQSWKDLLVSLATARGARERDEAYRALYKRELGAGIGLGESILSKTGGALLGGKQGQGVGDVLSSKISSYFTQFVTNQLLQGSLLTQQVSVGGANLGVNTETAAAVTAMAATQGAQTGVNAGTAIASAAPMSFLGKAVAGIASILPFARGGVVPAAAGGWKLPSSFGSDSVLSALTPGEMVLPRHISERLQRALGENKFGAGDMHVHFGTGATFLDGPSFRRWFMESAGGRRMFMDTINEAIKRFSATSRVAY